MRQCIAQARRRRNTSGSSASNPPLISIMNIDTSITRDDFIHFVRLLHLPLPYRLQYGVTPMTPKPANMALARFGTLEETAVFVKYTNAFPLKGRFLMSAPVAQGLDEIRDDRVQLSIFNVAETVERKHLLEAMDALFVPRPCGIACVSEADGVPKSVLQFSSLCVQGILAIALFHSPADAVKAKERLNQFMLHGLRLCVEFAEA
ncbi:hypothetical protein IWZ00DRAFT_136838 [Phyllosticta capitalensis]